METLWKNGYDDFVIGKKVMRSWINSELKFEQMEILRITLVETTSVLLEMNFSLWTRQAIQNLVIKSWGILVSSI